ncbi:MAG: ABC transporter substrate binding protein, partial [Streptococcus mitis]|nr:ABC transporter substrate binding protein [Streptococcus mitis]
MKNKRLIGIIVALAVLVAGSLIYSSMNKPEAKNEKKVAKVGVLQFVSHPSLDLIYKGIQDGLAEEGYKDGQIKIDFMN